MSTSTYSTCNANGGLFQDASSVRSIGICLAAARLEDPIAPSAMVAIPHRIKKLAPRLCLSASGTAAGDVCSNRPFVQPYARGVSNARLFHFAHFCIFCRYPLLMTLRRDYYRQALCWHGNVSMANDWLAESHSGVISISSDIRSQTPYDPKKQR